MFGTGMRCACVALFSAGICFATDTVPVKVISTQQPISAVGKTGLPPLVFKRYVSTIPVGETLGTADAGWLKVDRGAWKWNDKVSAEFQSQFRLVVNKELEAFGYPCEKKRDNVFETESKPQDSALELGVLLREVKLHIHFPSSKCEGEMYLNVKWALFNPKTQKVLVEIPVEGSFQTGPNSMGLDEIFSNAVKSVTHNLMASPAFLAALSGPTENGAGVAGGPAYSFPALLPPKGGTAKNSTMLCAAVVTLESSEGSGSGFYITRDGYLLTDRHVVGEAKFVKVRTATGREMPGEVVSVNIQRDVALVKTQKMPFDPLSLRLTDPTAGDEVYAIGSPLGEQFNGSVTHGVVSGFRDVNKTRFLQSDVSVLPGNSGGPLVDGSGAVIGITVAGLAARGGNMNFFIPIADALTSLSVEMKAAGPSAEVPKVTEVPKA